MYLIINDVKYTCSRRDASKNEIKYMTVSPAVDLDTLSGTVQMYTDDGFLLSEDSVDKFERKTMSGNLFVMTNKPAPKPADYTKQPEYRIYMLEIENKRLHERLAESDEVAIDLYESILELSEALEGLKNG